MVKMFGGHLQCCEDEGSNSVSFWFTIPLECYDAVPPSPSVMMRKQLTVTPDIANQSISSYPPISPSFNDSNNNNINNNNIGRFFSNNICHAGLCAGDH